jgi:hypothetical protein
MLNAQPQSNMFSGGASFSGAELVLIFLSSLAIIIFPDADLP